MRGKGSKARVAQFGRQAALSWTATSYQIIARRGRQCPHPAAPGDEPAAHYRR